MKYALVLTTALVISHAAAAQQKKTDWYLLDFGRAQCIKASTKPYMSSPLMLEQSLRNEGSFRKTTIKRNDDGTIMFVVVEAKFVGHDDTTSILYFPSEQGCIIGKAAALIGGSLNDPDELK